MNMLRSELERLSAGWIENGLPSREKVVSAAHTLMRFKQRHGLIGLWPSPPRMLSATLDDAIGQGIDIINLFAGVIGLDVGFLGLMQTPQKIVAACSRVRPRYLGVTVLQLDTEDDLAAIGHQLPPTTRLIAGGPAFKYDPELAQRCGVHAAAADVARFIEFLLNDVNDL